MLCRTIPPFGSPGGPGGSERFPGALENWGALPPIFLDGSRIPRAADTVRTDDFQKQKHPKSCYSHALAAGMSHERHDAMSSGGGGAFRCVQVVLLASPSEHWIYPHHRSRVPWGNLRDNFCGLISSPPGAGNLFTKVVSKVPPRDPVTVRWINPFLVVQ